MDDIYGQIESIMSKVAILPVAERQLLLHKIKRSVDQTQASCTEKQLCCLPNSLDANPDSIDPNQFAKPPSLKPPVISFRRKSHPMAKSRQYAVSSKPRLTLACPVCDLKSTNWQKFLHHLHAGHNQSSVTSVCRRCHGMFKNHALLLAHECFRWGRTNLPCAAVYSSIEDSPMLNGFDFPQEGVYLERRCGLCLTSDLVYSNFEQYERHKYEEHAESGSRAPICDIQRPQNKSFQAPASALLASKPLRKAKKSKSQKSVPRSIDNPENGSIRTSEPPSIAVEERAVSSVQATSTSDGSVPMMTRVFSCRVCKLFFRTHDRLLRHEKTSIVHGRRLNRSKRFKLTPVPESALGRPFECSECGLVYTRKHALDRHVAFAHNGETAFRCEFCSFHALDRANFRQHMSRHFHLKNFACEHCDHRCITKQELEDHVRFKHSDKRDFKCPDCQATFKTAGTLSRHQKTHTDVSFLCSHCDASFNRMSNLKRHKDSVHSSDSANRRGRGRPLKATRWKHKSKKANPQLQQQQQRQQSLPMSTSTMAVTSGLEPLWDYDTACGRPTTDIQLCTTVTHTNGLEPVYVVAFETESGWIPATSGSAAITDEDLLVHQNPSHSHPHSHPQPPSTHSLSAPRGDTVLPCVSDFFSFLPSAPLSAQLDDRNTPPPTSSSQAPSTTLVEATPHPPTNHLWRSDDLGATISVPTDDLICDFLACEVVGAEEDVEGTGDVGVVGSNFSVGYLIGGTNGVGGVDGAGGGGGGEELHTLPSSDCLSLVPIVTSAFEEPTAGGSDACVRVSATFQPFWTATCSSSCTSAAGIVHEEDYSSFEQQNIGGSM